MPGNEMRLPQQTWPASHAVVSESYPGTKPEVTEKIALAAQLVDPKITDMELAEAIVATHWPRQRSPQAWIGKVPRHLINAGESLRVGPMWARGKGPTKADDNQALIDKFFEKEAAG